MSDSNVRTYLCRITDCGRRGYARGVCRLHYDRQRTTGTTDDPQPRTRNSNPCSVRDCTRPYCCKGLCRLHWERQHKTGTTDDPQPRTGTRNSVWKGEDVGYTGVHRRLSLQSRPEACEHCGTTQGRFEWALRIDVPEARLKRSDEGWPYSTDPADYQNLCKSCHNRQDRGRKNRKEVV